MPGVVTQLWNDPSLGMDVGLLLAAPPLDSLKSATGHGHLGPGTGRDEGMV